MLFIALTDAESKRPIWVQASQIIAVREYRGRSRVVCSGSTFQISEPPATILLALGATQAPEIVAEPAPER